MRLAEGGLIQDVGALEEAGRVIRPSEPEAGDVQMVHELVAERGQHDASGDESHSTAPATGGALL